MTSNEDISISLCRARSRALASADTLKPITIAPSALPICLISPSVIGPAPFWTILNSAPSLSILPISFSIASRDPATSAFKTIGIIFLVLFSSDFLSFGETFLDFQFSTYARASSFLRKDSNSPPIAGSLQSFESSRYCLLLPPSCLFLDYRFWLLK